MQFVVARRDVAMHRLNASRAVAMYNGRDLALPFRTRRRDLEHVRTGVVHVEVLRDLLGAHGGGEGSEVFAELDLGVDELLQLVPDWQREDAAVSERAWPELTATLEPPDDLTVGNQLRGAADDVGPALRLDAIAVGLQGGVDLGGGVALAEV